MTSAMVEQPSDDVPLRALGSPSQPSGSPDYTARVGYGFMAGVYLGINAIRDLYLLVEGPDCAYMKTQFVQGNHDWLSTLTSVSGVHRVANTALHPDVIATGRELIVQNKLEQMARHAVVPAVALTSMPVAAVTAVDYDRLCREVSEKTGKPVFSVPGKSLSGDWLDGYAELLLGLAEAVPLPNPQPNPKRVAIVGHLFERNEGDQTANIRELQRLVEGLGFELVSVWPCGQSFAELSHIRSAGMIISLPYGRKAAQKLAKRLVIPCHELPLPFGLPATEAFVQELGRISGLVDVARTFIDHELSRIVPKLEWIVPFLFLGRSFGFIGEPHVVSGLVSFAETLGMKCRFLVITNRPHHTASAPLPKNCETLIYPKLKTFSAFLQSFMQHKGGIDLLITNNEGLSFYEHTAVLGLGFPSPFHHALYERPTLGFDGALALADSMSNLLRQQELVEIARRYQSNHAARKANHDLQKTRLDRAATFDDMQLPLSDVPVGGTR